MPKVPKIRSFFLISSEKNMGDELVLLPADKYESFLQGDGIIFPVSIYMFKVNNRNNRTTCEICSKLTIKTPEQRQALIFCFQITSNISSNWYYHFRWMWPGMPKLPKITSWLFLCNILRKKWVLKLIFCMQVSMKVSYKLILWFLMWMIKYFQSIQNNKLAISQGKREEQSWFFAFNPRLCIIENCKYFTAALIYNNIESGHPRWTPPVRVKGLDKEVIYFDFILDIRITNFNDMDEFVPVTKHMKGSESKITIHPVRKNPKKWQLTVC